MEIIKLTKDNFASLAEQSDVPVLIDFWASWCGPCKMLAPVIDELAAESDGSYKVGKVNVDDDPELASRFGVFSIPTVIVMKDGKVAATSVGVRPKQVLAQLLGK
ncbi:MAG: thioredoxin [Clostridiales bacterium]|nr:thioredoxin [Clostridiales bacterium]